MPEEPISHNNPPSEIVPSESELSLIKEEPSQISTLRSSITYDWSYATKDLLDTLPQLWTRGLLYFLLVFIGITLPWAMLSRVDETGTARGRLEPTGKTIKLDAPVAGTVAAIEVKAGERVQAGQTLLELESELIHTELQQQQWQLEGQKNRLSQLQLLKNQLLIALRTQQQQSQAQQSEKESQIEQAQHNLNSLRAAYNLQKAEKLAQLEQARQAIESSQATYRLEQIRLQTAQEKIPRYRYAYEQGALPQERFLEAQQLVKEAQENVMKAQLEIQQAQSRLKEQKGSYETMIHQAASEINQAQLRLQEQERSLEGLIHSGELAILKSQEQLNNVETQIATLEAEIAQSKSQIQSLELQLNQRSVKAPIEGIIFESLVKTEGSVVQAGETIVEIAPQNSSLLLRAEMATAESGSLRIGMPVKIKFDAYPFQDYGIVQGIVMKISPTSKIKENPQGNTATYELEIKLNQSCLPTPKECLPFRPGDTATAEVIIRQHRIIDVILDPFKKLQEGGLKL